MTRVPVWAWFALGVTALVLLAIDLFGHRGDHGRSKRAAVIWTLVWIAAGLGYNGFVWATMGGRAAQEYFAAYLIEKALSVDNLFVFMIVFQSLKVPREHHHRVLFWGIFGALVFRALFVFAGVAALENWQWISYVFGGILLFAAWRAFREDPAEKRENRTVKWLSRHLPLTHETVDGSFIRKEHGARVATPLLIAIVAVELTDIVFAVDSVPAALSVSRDRFIVFASNAFAVFGLRALYTVLAETLENMRYLHYGLAGVLTFAGAKLVLSGWFEISPLLSIGIIASMIGAAAIASVRARRPRRTGVGRRARAT